MVFLNLFFSLTVVRARMERERARLAELERRRRVERLERARLERERKAREALAKKNNKKRK